MTLLTSGGGARSGIVATNITTPGIAAMGLTTTPAPFNSSGNAFIPASSASGQATMANNIAQAIATDLVANANAAASAANTTATTSGTVATTTATTDNPFLDWLGLSTTPTADMISGIPNWVIAAGGIGLVIWLMNSGSGEGGHRK